MPIETYQERMVRERASEALAQAKREARVQEIAAQQQRNQAWQAEQATRQAEIEKQQRERNARLERLRSGEEVASIKTLDQAMRESTEAVNARQKQERRELEATPEHQRLMNDPGWHRPPAVQEAQKREYFASRAEMTVDESYNALQAAKQDVAKEEKQLNALQSGRVLSPGELPYQQQRLEQAKQQEQQALAQFNELAGVLSQT